MFVSDAFKEKVMADEHSRRVSIKRGGRGGNSRYRVDRRNQRYDPDDPGPDFYNFIWKELQNS